MNSARSAAFVAFSLKKCLNSKGMAGSGALRSPCGVDEDKFRAAGCSGGRDPPVEARAPAGVAAAAVAADPDLQEDGVLVAVDAYLDDALNLPARRPFAPKLGPRARPIPGLPGLERLGERRRVDMGDHQDLARVGVRRDAGDE